jgi:hypothetical protein
MDDTNFHGDKTKSGFARFKVPSAASLNIPEDLNVQAEL